MGYLICLAVLLAFALGWYGGYLYKQQEIDRKVLYKQQEIGRKVLFGLEHKKQFHADLFAGPDKVNLYFGKRIFKAGKAENEIPLRDAAPALPRRKEYPIAALNHALAREGELTEEIQKQKAELVRHVTTISLLNGQLRHAFTRIGYLERTLRLVKSQIYGIQSGLTPRSLDDVRTTINEAISPVTLKDPRYGYREAERVKQLEEFLRFVKRGLQNIEAGYDPSPLSSVCDVIDEFLSPKEPRDADKKD